MTGNTVFQGLAADGAKLGLWNVWRAGYRIVNFIHDELLVAIPKTVNLLQEAQSIADLMKAGMQEVVPDIQIGVETQIVSCWSKDALVDLDEVGI